MRRVGIGMFLALALAACARQPQTPIFEGPEVDAIRATDAQLNAAIERRDANAAAAFYESYSLITEPLRVEEMTVGVTESYRRLFADQNGRLSYDYATIEVAPSRDFAVSQSDCSVARTNPKPHGLEGYLGQCMKEWRRGADGHWRIVRELRSDIMTRY